MREEARSFLVRVQESPGFAERLGTVGPVPALASALPFWSIRRFARGDESTGKIVWQYLSEAALTEEQRRWAAELEADGHPVWVEGSGGKRTLRVPGYIPTPDDEARDEIEFYREAVETFADDFLLNAQWAPSAVHDALRHGKPIALPPPPSVERVAPPVRELVRLDPDIPLPRSRLRELGEALVAASEFKQELGRDRTATWAGGLDAVRAKLDGQPLSATQRSHRFRGCRLLDGAANGVLGVDPVDWAHEQRLAKPEFELWPQEEGEENGKANS